MHFYGKGALRGGEPCPRWSRHLRTEHSPGSGQHGWVSQLQAWLSSCHTSAKLVCPGTKVPAKLKLTALSVSRRQQCADSVHGEAAPAPGPGHQGDLGTDLLHRSTQPITHGGRQNGSCMGQNHAALQVAQGLSPEAHPCSAGPQQSQEEPEAGWGRGRQWAGTSGQAPTGCSAARRWAGTSPPFPISQNRHGLFSLHTELLSSEGESKATWKPEERESVPGPNRAPAAEMALTSPCRQEVGNRKSREDLALKGPTP